MNNVKDIANQPLIKWNNQIVITTALLAEAYEANEQQIQQNFNNHKENFTKGKHYYLLQGEELKEFKRCFDNIEEAVGVSKFAPQLYLWTERGANRHCKILDTDKAWEQFDNLEETYFRVKEMTIDRSELSPQTQALVALTESIAKTEIEQKRQAEKLNKIETAVTTMKEIFTTAIGDWKSEINSKIRTISIKSGIDYETIYTQMYGELENTAHCSLKRLQENKVDRMKKAGNTKAAIKDGTTKIAIIHEKPQLKAIFENIVRRYAMSYCVEGGVSK